MKLLGKRSCPSLVVGTFSGMKMLANGVAVYPT